MQNLIELEYVIDFLKQEPCIDMDLHEAYFSCPFCEKDYLDVFKKIFKKKYLKYIMGCYALILKPEILNVFH